MIKFRQMGKRQKLFLFLLPLAAVFAVGVLFVSGRAFWLEKNCGCGPLAGNPAGEFDSLQEQALFNNKPVDYELAELPELNQTVLGQSSDDRWIEIDLSEQKLFAHEGSRIVYEFLVSSGKPWTPTVTGEFRVWTKFRYAKMSGGSRALGNYYYLPNVPFIQYFHGDYGLHGAYWHNNFGNTMSHGCVNLAIPDAEKLFYWTSPIVPEGRGSIMASKDNPGTRVVIHN